MRIHLASDFNDIAILENEWNNMVQGSETNTVFLTYEWIYSWWKVFGKENELLFITVFSDDRAVGFAPLMINRAPKGKRKLMFISEGNADYSDFVVIENKKPVLHAIFEKIFELRDRWDMISLLNIPEGSSTIPPVMEICERFKYKSMMRNNIVCPSLLIKGHDEEVKKMISKYSFRRPYNHLKKIGEVSCFDINCMDEGNKYFEIFFQQHIERWKGTRYPSLFMDEKAKSFYSELFKNSLSRKLVIFSVLEFNGIPIAFHFGFDYNSKIIWYKPSYDIRYSKMSPGKVLIKYLIENSFYSKKDEFDFSIGDEPFKKRFSNMVRKNSQLHIFKNRADYLFQVTSYGVRKIIKRLFGENIKTRHYIGIQGS